jgi:heat-inducible transcriptional repressor
MSGGCMPEKGLTRREEDLLLSVIRCYADSKKPVSSGDLKEVCSESLSTSSLRAVLNNLESKGFLAKEHVSSGRMPTDLAYRHFASVALKNISLIDIKNSCRKPPDVTKDVRTMAKELTRVISEKHRSVGFATAPSLMDARLSMCELYPVSREKIVFLGFSAGGRMFEHILNHKHNYTLEHLKSFSNYITRNYRGWTFREIRGHLKKQLVVDREKVANWVLEALALIAPAVEQLPSDVELFWDGLEWLVDIPEIAADRLSLKALVETVEKKEKLIELLDELLFNGKESTIALGADWPLSLNPPSLTLIAVSYGVDGAGKGVLGLIGPKTMNYDEALPNLSCSAMLLTEASVNLSAGGRNIV